MALDVMRDGRFPAAFHAGALRLHRALFTDGSLASPLVLPGAGRDLRSAVEARSPPAAWTRSA